MFSSMFFTRFSLSRRFTSTLARSSLVRSKAQTQIAAIDALRPGPILIDTHNRAHDYLRISLTEKCNLRCFYCMPEEGIPLAPPSHSLTDDEVVRLASIFVRAGVTKIRLTGGEPTIRQGIVQLITRLNTLRQHGLQFIGMTSNGLVLHRYLQDLHKNGLTHVNLSLDTLDPFKFELITRRRGHSAVLKTLKQALSIPGLTVKLNMVVIRGLNDHEVLDFVELIKSSPLSVRMIEYMPFQGNKWDFKKMVPSSELLSTIKEHYSGVSRCSDALNDTARNYRIPGYAGSFGFISSMSDHFCATCNRLRLTSDGQIKVCLFDAKEVSLRDMMRGGATDEELLTLIKTAVLRKAERHGGKEDINEIDVVNNRPMISIGGPKNRQRFFPYPDLFVSPTDRNSSRWARHYSSNVAATRQPLSHIDAQGRASMVDVSDKTITSRSATAQGRIFLPRHAYDLIAPNSNVTLSLDPVIRKAQEKAKSKGDVFTVAQLAGIMGAKSTSRLIPLCHPLAISHIDVALTPEENTERLEFSVLCRATVRCRGSTGVEMEALTAVNVALLTVWDMLKATAGREMKIGDIFVTEKSGGAGGDFSRQARGEAGPPV